MKKLILVRIGQVPNPMVTAALIPHMTGRPVAFPIPGAIVSIFDTQSSIEQVSESIKETGAFFFLMEQRNAAMHLPPEVMEIISQVTEGSETSTSSQPEQELSIDDVLDLITQNGIESLTPAQKQILDQSRQ
jgi:hypothetical protein